VFSEAGRTSQPSEVPQAIIAPGESTNLTFTPLLQSVPMSLAESCTPLDIIVLLDQSDSMATYDRNDLRIDAVGNLIDTLYENAALRCPGVTHRIGVVSFGSSAQETLTLDRGAIYVENPDSDWETPRNRLKSAIQSQQLGATAFYEAFQTAQNLFDTAAPLPGAGQKPRARAIIVATDGEPCTPASTQCSMGSWLNQYFNGTSDDSWEGLGFEVQRGLRAGLNELLTANTAVHVLMFRENQAPTQEVVNQSWSLITSEHRGTYFQPQQIVSLKQIAVIFADITSGLIGTTPNIIPITNVNGQCVGEFYLEPYISSTALINATRPDNERIQIIDPNGNTLPSQNAVMGPSRIRYNAGQSIERFIVFDPTPGRWTIVDPTGEQCEVVTAAFETISLNIAATPPPPIVPNIRPPYTQPNNSNGVVQITLTDSIGNRFEETRGYPLNICGRARYLNNARPDIQQIVNNLECISFQAQGNGVWQSELLPAPAQGTYQLTLTATTAAANPDDVDGLIEIFETTLSYTTAPPVALSLEIRAPRMDAVIPLNNLSTTGEQGDLPFNVEVQFVNSSGQRQPVSEIFPLGVGQAVQARLHGINGTASPERTLFLAPSALNADVLTGEFATPDGRPDPRGSFEIIFETTDEGLNAYNTDNYLLNETPASVTFTRRELAGIKLVTTAPDRTTFSC